MPNYDDRPLDPTQGYGRQTTQTSSPASYEPQPQVTMAPTHQRPKKGHPFWWGLLGGVLCSALTVGVLWLTGNLGHGQTVVQTGPEGQVVEIQPNGDDVTLAEVVSAKCLPSVVSLYVSGDEGTYYGSGVILDTEGHILTNSHLTESGKTIQVISGDKSYEAELTGEDPTSDLAVVKADFKGDAVTPMAIGDSSKVVVGEWVMAIGSPFGNDQSVSTGIVSALYRSSILNDYSGKKIYTNLIQTDAAINPGNSGGALVNEAGELVGINSMINTTSGSSAGVGFAIPVNYAMKVAETIMAGKTVEHTALGVQVTTVNAQLARTYRLPVDTGAYVTNVVAGSGAAAAGLKVGDIITALGDQSILSGDQLILEVRSLEIGDKTTITYYRDGQEHTVDVTLGSDAGTSASASDELSNQTAPEGQAGPSMSDEQLWDALREQFEQYLR